MKPSTITRPLVPRAPSMAVFQAASISDASRIVLCPLPDELMMGFTTQGRPMASTAARNSASVSAKR